MFLFNNDSIVTGYIKQLLAEFNLPKYRVYTKEQEKFFNENGYEKDVISTVYRNSPVTYADRVAGRSVDYPLRMRYAPYIKDGIIQEYSDGAWHSCHATLGNNNHKKIHDETNHDSASPIVYNYNVRKLNYTTNLTITNNIYDSHTHEYLGNYLRFIRDYHDVNLMPLYNCFSNRVCPKLKISIKVDNNYTATFDTAEAGYKIYMLPVKLFKDYTVAIDSETPVEICCGIFGKYQNTDRKFDIVSALSYECYNNLQFNKPVLFTGVKNLTSLLGEYDASELAQHEDDLKLFIKLPIANESSITILEGNYINYINGTMLPDVQHYKETVPGYTEIGADMRPHEVMRRVLGTGKNKYIVNKLIVNEEYDFDNSVGLITPLQLLKCNTGKSYPFADRLIEYICGNVIDSKEEISHNVRRVKTAARAYNEDIVVDDLWTDNIRLVMYNYMSDRCRNQLENHDILGYVDSSVERNYSFNKKVYNKVKKQDEIVAETLVSLDLYSDTVGGNLDE